MSRQIRSTISIAIILAVGLVPFMYISVIYIQSYSIIASEVSFRQPEPSVVLDRHGSVIARFFHEDRRYVPASAIPLTVRHAFIAAEDTRFYHHQGIDESGIVRAFLSNIVSPGRKQGGSTITQQIVKQFYTQGERTMRRKILEFFLVKNLESRFSKEQILEIYLNKTYFGHGAYGVAAAASFYFRKDIGELSSVEAAILAGIPPAPAVYSPLRNPAAAFRKSRVILDAMRECGFLSDANPDELHAAYWPAYADGLLDRAPTETVFTTAHRAGFFIEDVRAECLRRFGAEELYQGGLRIHTTLDATLQEAAERAVRNAVAAERPLAQAVNAQKLRDIDAATASKLGPGGTKLHRLLREELADDLMLLSLLAGSDLNAERVEAHSAAVSELTARSNVEGALVALDISDGGILALCGGADFGSDNQLNRATAARRQPGSAFKPFVYGAAIAAGKVRASESFLDLPIINKADGRTRKNKRNARAGKDWMPENYDGTFRGSVLARDAFALSLNTVPVLIYDSLGGRPIIDLAAGLCGIDRKRFTNDPTLPLGTSELTVIEMTRGIASFARSGETRPTYFIRAVDDRSGKRLYEAEIPPAEKILAPEAAFIVCDMMRDVINRGTAYQSVRRDGGLTGDVAGKTGTNTGFRDAWFTGFSGAVAATVWIGCDSPVFALSHGRAGSVSAAPAWAIFMKEAMKRYKGQLYRDIPENIESRDICVETGLLPVAGCRIRKEYYIKGSVPTEHCTGEHMRMMSYDELAGGRND